VWWALQGEILVVKKIKDVVSLEMGDRIHCYPYLEGMWKLSMDSIVPLSVAVVAGVGT
jgi:hypothetical protein